MPSTFKKVLSIFQKVLSTLESTKCCTHFVLKFLKKIKIIKSVQTYKVSVATTLLSNDQQKTKTRFRCLSLFKIGIHISLEQSVCADFS